MKPIKPRDPAGTVNEYEERWQYLQRHGRILALRRILRRVPEMMAELARLEAREVRDARPLRA